MTTNTVRVGRRRAHPGRVRRRRHRSRPRRAHAEQVAAVTWAEPLWAEGDQVRAGAAVWVIQDGDARIAVDPAQAADDVIRTDDDAALHQEAFAGVLEAARHAARELYACDLDPRRGDRHVGVAQRRRVVGPRSSRTRRSWCRSASSMRSIAASIRHRFTPPSRNCVSSACTSRSTDGERVTANVSLEHAGAHTPGHAVRARQLGRRAGGDGRSSRSVSAASRDRPVSAATPATRRGSTPDRGVTRRRRGVDRPVVADARRRSLGRQAAGRRLPV